MANSKQTRTAQQRIARFFDTPHQFHETQRIIDNGDDTPILPLSIAVESVMSFLPNLQFFVNDAIEQCRSTPTDGLTIDESAAIKLYTMEAQFFKKPLYAVLNEVLRSGNQQKLQPWLFYIKLLRTALSRLPSVSQPVFRGVKLDFSEKYHEGETIVWSSFSSCTTSVNALQAEDFFGQSGDRTMFVINCISGKDIRNHSCFPDENEILLLPEAKFTVLALFVQVMGCT